MSLKQSYKIYINEVQLLLISSTDQHLFTAAEDTLVVAYMGKVKMLINYIDMCEKKPKFHHLVIHYNDYNELKKDFLSLFEINEAGGGLIQNDFGEFLFIFRRGFWDLPKGKIEAGETKKQAAVREVIEETGLKKVDLLRKLCVTKHTFRNRLGKRIIKKSHWYLMHSQKQELKPQISEDIEKAVWMKIDEFRKECLPVYGNIIDVLDALEKEYQPS